ncbi:MAG: Rieske (2Fe-2S) protein [Rhodospirillaceae bacterium]
MREYGDDPKIDDKGPGTILCPFNELDDPGAKGFRVGRRPRIFVVRVGINAYGYINLCPHQGTPLDWKPDAFLTVEEDAIMCATHGALFDIEDGKCTWGPCLGMRLASVPITIEDGLIKLEN